jgi:hypothetical protein
LRCSGGTDPGPKEFCTSLNSFFTIAGCSKGASILGLERASAPLFASGRSRALGAVCFNPSSFSNNEERAA